LPVDPFNLARFVNAQDEGGTFDRAVAELRQGRKNSHWMWFIFPQIAGLGHSETSRKFAIRSLDEAKAYLTHEVLGARLLECVSILSGQQEPDAESIFGAVDAVKLRSSMTLFALAADDPTPFQAVLDRYFEGAADNRTLELLA
jgi:uncharacterized protein (DUF1810 family)